MNNGVVDVQRDQQCELLKYGELISRISLRVDRARSPMASACLPCEVLTSSHVDLTKTCSVSLAKKRIRKGNQPMCVSNCPRARLISSYVCFLTCAIEKASKLHTSSRTQSNNIEPHKIIHRDSLSWCLCCSRCLPWSKFFCVQESKIGSEAYMSGCTHKKSDLKPKHFSARLKKKDLKPQLSVCKSNNVTGAAAPISRRRVTTKWFHAEFQLLSCASNNAFELFICGGKPKHFSQPDVQLFMWVSLPPIAAWLTSERFSTLMVKTPAICFCDAHLFFRTRIQSLSICVQKSKKKGSVLQDFVAWHGGCLFALAHIMHTCQLRAPLRQSHAERGRSNRCSDTDTQRAGANARHQSCNTHAYEHSTLPAPHTEKNVNSAFTEIHAPSHLWPRLPSKLL